MTVAEPYGFSSCLRLKILGEHRNCQQILPKEENLALSEMFSEQV